MTAYYKCTNCGKVTREDELAGSNNPDSYNYGEYCPFCGCADLFEVKECEYCGEWYYVEDEVFDGCCYDCGHDAEDAMVKYMTENKPMTDKQKRIFLDYWGCL